MKEVYLTPAQVTSASGIQTAIDSLGKAGGRVTLPEMELTLDRGIALPSNVELVGQGTKTLLRKAPGSIYPLSGYHNYGMLDVPLMTSDGLEPGMTVTIRDDRHGGFFETFARITWVEGTWVGIDTGLHSDYEAELHPFLLTAFPLIYALEAEHIAVRNLTLDGNRGEQPAGIGACRGAAVYFLKSRHIEVEGVQETDFMGEGLGFQMCSHVTIRNCNFAGNSGNGYHPGAGSTGVLFDNCVGTANDAAGFFFCVRANHITVTGCTFNENVRCGISVGTRDSYNLIENCQIKANAGPGILFRQAVRPVEVQACRVTGCHISGNGMQSGHGQIDVLGDAHDLVFSHNNIEGPPEKSRAGIYLSPATEQIWLQENEIHGCFPAVVGREGNFASSPPPMSCGLNAAEDVHFRHLVAAG